MNKIILLLLFNILIYHLYYRNIYLLISLLIIMICYILRMSTVVEGNSEYKYKFANSLNDNMKKNRKKEYLYGSLIDKLNGFLEQYIDYEKIPDNQSCMGIFDSWSKCSTSCGIGSQYRKYLHLQYAGKDGIKCIYEDGQIERKTCDTGICNMGDDCINDNDCITNYCDPFIKTCGLKNDCTKYKLQNCNFDECNELGEYYHNKGNECVYYNPK